MEHTAQWPLSKRSLVQIALWTYDVFVWFWTGYFCICIFSTQPAKSTEVTLALPLASVPSKRSWSFSSSRLDDNRARVQNLTTLWLGMDFINYPVQFLNLISMSNCESLICFLQSQWSDSKCSLYLINKSCDRFV